MQLIVEKRGYRLLPLIALAIAAALLVLVARDSQAVHDDGLFELDVEKPGTSPPCPETNQGDPIIPCSNANTFDDSGAGAPYDWESVCKATNLTTNRTITEILPEPAGVGQSSCIADWALPDSTTFATGSKDILDIAAGGVTSGFWQCAQDNNVLEKNEIMNAYAALMSNPADDHDQLYLGLERPSNNGTSFVGFWFLLNDVSCSSTGPAQNWVGGLHVPGDLLILSDFSGGGRVSTVRILQWNPGNVLGLSQCTPGAPPAGSGNLIPDVNTGPLCEIAQPGQDCSTAVLGDSACAGVNSESVLTPWWNQPKQPPCATNKGGVQGPSGPGSVPCTVPLQSNTLFEGGIDLTAALCPGGTPCALPCFSTFVAETRSSDSETADLKDFARGDFEVCGKATIIKQTDPAGASGTFTYDSTLPCGDFSLVDADSTPAVGEAGVHHCDDLNPNTYYVTENDPTALTPPFDLVNIVCTVDNNPDGGTSAVIGKFVAGVFQAGPTSGYDPGIGEDTVKITIGTLGEVTCTYTNRQRGSILVRKEDEDGNLLPGACFTFDPDPADGIGAAVEVCDGDAADQANGDDGLVCIDNVVLKGDDAVPDSGYDVTESQAPPGYEPDPDTVNVVVDTPSTCADRLADTPVPDATFVNKLGTILIHKVSTKTGNPFVAGACFTIDDDAANPLAFSGTVCDDDFAAADFSDTDAADGVICVEDVPLGDYDVTETTTPDGYAGDDSIVSVTVDDSDSCADKAGDGGADATFYNVPLFDIQVNFRDAGSGETSLVPPISCDNATGTSDTTAATGWDDTLTIEDIETVTSPATVTITCTIEVDP